MYHEKTGRFPDGGCYNDQPETLLNDWATLDRRYADIYEHLRDAKEQETDWLPETLQDFPDAAPEPEIVPLKGLRNRLFKGA